MSVQRRKQDFSQKQYTEDFMKEEKLNLACWLSWVKTNGCEPGRIEKMVMYRVQGKPADTCMSCSHRRK